jgi:pilus assembly protein Flp/PilA
MCRTAPRCASSCAPQWRGWSNVHYLFSVRNMFFSLPGYWPNSDLRHFFSDPLGGQTGPASTSDGCCPTSEVFVSIYFWIARVSTISLTESRDCWLTRALMLAKLQAFIRDESGATAIEYGLIAAGISVAIIAVVNGIGTKLNTKFTSISSQLK